MKPSSYFCILCLWCLLILLINICKSSAFFSTPVGYTVSYNDHCSSIVPESTPTHKKYTQNQSIPHFITSYFTGGDKLLVKKASKKKQTVYYYAGKSLEFPNKPHFSQTKTKGIYKVEAYLYLRSPYRYHKYAPRNSSYGGSYYKKKRTYWSSMLIAELSGFWSEESRNLCMVGSATWQNDETSGINIYVVLKLNFPRNKNPTIYTSVVSGTLLSTNSVVGDLDYFEPISIFSFPILPNYSYSLVSKELEGGYFGNSKIPKNQSLSLQPNRFCSTLSGRFSFFELEYATECQKTAQNCSPFGGDDNFLPRFVFLNPIQCSEDQRKTRYLITFQNISYGASLYQNFGVNSTLIGEASWDDSNNQLVTVACRILDPANHFGSGVGDCTVRLSLRYPSVWNIRNDARIVGQIWTNKSRGDSGYFRKINLTSCDEHDFVASSQNLKYEYTELDRVTKLCPSKKKRDMLNTYPNGHFYDMRFDMFVKNGKGQKLGRGEAIPISIGNELYEGNHVVLGHPMMSKPTKNARNALLNISYKIIIRSFHEMKVGNWSANLDQGRVEITAEGVYDSETGCLCMLGCIKLLQKPTNDSMDCEILVNFQFPPTNDKKGSFIKGAIKTTRAKSDPLRFDDLSCTSFAFYQSVAKRFIWRLDFEITMVLISNTFLCIFVGLQLFHLKRSPEVISSISLVMVLILSLGHLIPIVLNLEAVFLDKSNTQRLRLKTGGRLEANEVAVRMVINMVAFLLQIRLLQLVWTTKARGGLWFAEKKASFVSLLMYILGGLVTLLLNQVRNGYSHRDYSLWVDFWGEFRPYVGLILDGFLVPQILLNAFRGSLESAVCAPFYIGTSIVRFVPHVYNQYRDHSYPTFHVNGMYYYANHAVDFYSTAWDIMIPCGIIGLAVIIFMQQRYGGFCILPQRFRRFELYEKVPVADNER